MGQIIKSLASVFSVSVCRHSYGRNFYSIFMKFCSVVGGLKGKIAFVWGKNPITTSPILPQLLPPVIHFQWEGSNTTVRTMGAQ